MRTVLVAAAAVALAGCSSVPVIAPARLHDADWATVVRARENLAHRDTILLNTKPWPDADAYKRALCEEAGRRLKWSEQETRDIADAKVWAGMSNVQLTWSWGKPFAITTTEAPTANYAHWDYTPYNPGPTIVTLEGETVVWWHIEETR